jgi:thiosulfate/3-mercaptopyruvate sulfurtransferase
MNAPYPNSRILVETDWLAAHLHEPDLRLVDCNVRMTVKPEGGYEIAKGRDDWARAHIPGADFIDLVEELSAPHPRLRFMMPSAEQFAAVVGAHGIGNRHRVVLYSAGLNYWATRLLLMFRAMGHDAVQVLNGGWDKWTLERRPTSQEAPLHPPERFVPHPRPGQIVGKDEVRAALGDPRTCLINALSPDVFSGRKVQYGRPGHIPGSRNVYAADLIDPVTKTFRPAEELRARLAAAGALDAERVITYCGGGISATTDSFALLLLGYDNVALYDGSMTEWGPDASLPMATA